MVTAREHVARSWHAGSDHADGTPFGGPLCNCNQVAGRIMPMLAAVWNAAVGSLVHDDGTPVEVVANINPYEAEEDQ